MIGIQLERENSAEQDAATVAAQARPAPRESLSTRAYAELQAAELMVREGCALFDAGQPCGPQANMGKMLASEASWHAGEACLQAHGGFGFAREYDVERKFRETGLYQVAPISTNMILSYLGEHVLGMPRSY